MATQLRETPAPHTRPTHPFAPLPSRRPHQLSISIPYHDDPEDDEVLALDTLPPQRSPPGYEPMYDYLRSHQQRPTPQPAYHDCQTLPHQLPTPYRDEPFVVTITDHDAAPPPPSYSEIYSADENGVEMRSLLQRCEADGAQAEQTEEICKWVVAMLLVALTIAGVGTAFHWGQPGCQDRAAWRC